MSDTVLTFDYGLHDDIALLNHAKAHAPGDEHPPAAILPRINVHHATSKAFAKQTLKRNNPELPYGYPELG